LIITDKVPLYIQIIKLTFSLHSIIQDSSFVLVGICGGKATSQNLATILTKTKTEPDENGQLPEVVNPKLK